MCVFVRNSDGGGFHINAVNGLSLTLFKRESADARAAGDDTPRRE